MLVGILVYNADDDGSSDDQDVDDHDDHSFMTARILSAVKIKLEIKACNKFSH